MTIPNSEGFFQSESCLPCTPEEEKKIITELMGISDNSMKEGDLYYLLSQRWWMAWQQYVGSDQSNHNSDEGLFCTPHRPGEIDNSCLVLNQPFREGNELDLKRGLQEGEDYNLVPQEVWKKLLEWYHGGPELPRKVISEGFITKKFNVEVYPLCLQLVDGRNKSQRTIKISRMASVRELYEMVCTLFQLEQDKVCLWDCYNKVKNKMLTNFDQTLVDAQLTMDQEVLLEVQDDNIWSSNVSVNSSGNELALVPLEPSRSSVTIAGGPTLSNSYSTVYNSNLLQGSNFSTSVRDTEDGDDVFYNGSKVDGRGLTGLHNLGNTCFMNSALQCLVHTPPLVDYFLQDYSEEINKENPLGLQGELAIVFGELLRKLWSSGRTSVAPRAFKAKLARFAPQFSGYNQHDSQELLAFLLDGLHEDLNRVKSKPYIEAEDANGRPDEEFAQVCWKNHKSRNDSIIVDVCQGQYKSTLVCPICNKVSVTFDPFMYLSLPLTSNASRTMTVTMFNSDGNSLPMPFTVTVPKNGCCKDLIQALGTASCIKHSETLLLAEVYSHRIYRYLENAFESLSSIKDEEHIVAYKLPIHHDRLLKLEIMHLRAEGFSSEPQYNAHLKLLGTPLVTCLSVDSRTGADIHAAVRSVLSPLLRANALSSLKGDKCNKDNGCGPSLDAIVLSDNGIHCSNDLSTSKMELEEMDDGFPSLQLALADGKVIIRTTVDVDYNVSPGSSLKIMMTWADKEHEIYDFSFLDDLPEVFKTGFMLKKTRQEAVTLYSCLEAFLKEEPLGPEDMWYCPKCKEHRQATKKLDLWRLPEILVVHLKRFSYSRFLKNKLDTFVNFLVHNLDLTKYVKQRTSASESHIYELYAVSNHYGGLGGGHYSAYAKLIEEDSWYHFDDSHVSPVKEDEIKTSAAYVLFYQRVKCDSSMGVGKN
ncbi:ubiquitin carboxyl-terminal hydrolase 9 [Canna indica]|uniref:Ubiquitin carboxyl-terminal hydrolase n=1 Tax=Canna indica TaxID=4628 RepID=A0AAQ3QCZ8_9LILI|nr:ubiquitin carboxyl-terminal hydrolase 9 [Canna indica]